MYFIMRKLSALATLAHARSAGEHPYGAASQAQILCRGLHKDHI